MEIFFYILDVTKFWIFGNLIKVPCREYGKLTFSLKISQTPWQIPMYSHETTHTTASQWYTHMWGGKRVDKEDQLQSDIQDKKDKLNPRFV